ncbi:aluminum-activated malate transporter 10-like [Macadamia integrifolia]|uniref:aluminum-activated malate transporter 10-like n=1 Tax=Macadamia integrifolia TaxID=60698 RepID=UPI001C52B525|nr:aluminum-activated malate transporter 10-like [Macadamia integrifolia]
MVNGMEASGGLQWRVRMTNGSSSELLVPESGPIHRTWLGLLGLLVEFTSKFRKFFKKAWALGVDDPKKVIHCLKVGMALTIVSLFYYMRPLYEGVGGNAIWAVMTVVVVFEYSVGATLSKSLNRITGTVVAGSLAIGVHWIASQSGERFEPVILGSSVFLLASAATFSRFIPTIKARFDYGAMIFILTFSLVSVSGFRVEKLFQMAHTRLSTIAIGTSLCMLISMLVCPIWAGEELHLLITRNMEKLANSLDGCVTEYFKEMNSDGDVENEDKDNKSLLGYKCVLNSKGAEDTFANFARWEPAHGQFNFSHPWNQYLKIGASLRTCACCMEALNGCINSEVQAPDFVKRFLSNACIVLSSHSSRVLKELAITITTATRRSTQIDLSVEDMKDAVQELQKTLTSLPSLLTPPPSPFPEAPEEEKKEPISTPTIVPLMEVVPLVTVASLLIEIVTKIEGVVEAVNELQNLADFKPDETEKLKPTSDYQDQQTMKALQQV